MSGHHGEHLRLGPEQIRILSEGISELIGQAEGLSFGTFASDKHPLPLTRAVYGDTPQVRTVFTQIRERLDGNPVAVLEQALVLAELIESAQPDHDDYILADGKFLSTCFNIKRCNGWAFVLGKGDHSGLARSVNEKWQYKFFYTGDEPPSTGHAFRIPDRPTGMYYFMNLMIRYGFVYGRKGAKDAHDIGHFLEDFGPGVLILQGKLTSLDFTLALAAMKLGIPALVPESFPFDLGRRIVYKDDADIIDGITQFPNMRKLLDIPGLPKLPEYCDPQHKAAEFTPDVTYGATDDSFYFLAPRTGIEDGIEIKGTPQTGLGILVEAEHERLEEYDCPYIESTIISALSQIEGVRAVKREGRLEITAGNGIPFDPRKIGETLQASFKSSFPKIKNVRVTLIFDTAELARMAPRIRAERDARAARNAQVTEDSISEWYYCVGCSPFAPDHVCVLTPDRVPQCGRSFHQIRTGALFDYDDMSNIHHRVLHKEINSFGVLEKGTCLDPLKGEWSGINEHAVRLTDGRTPKVYLHTIFDHPTTGCGCFGIILFHIPEVDGIGIMDRAYDGKAPDGRSWLDLKFELAGKQTSGVSGCAAGYFASPKFLQADGGWQRIVWVTPKIWGMVKNRIPEGHTVAVGDEARDIDSLKTII